MPQFQVGELKSIKKMVRINADDSKALIIKNLGNGRRIPLVWATTVTVASGTSEVLVASGVAFSDFMISDAKAEASVVIKDGAGDTDLVGKVYIDKDTTLNMLTVKSTASASTDTFVDVFVFMGLDATYTSDSSNMLWKSSGDNRLG